MFFQVMSLLVTAARRGHSSAHCIMKGFDKAGLGAQHRGVERLDEGSVDIVKRRGVNFFVHRIYYVRPYVQTVSMYACSGIEVLCDDARD